MKCEACGKKPAGERDAKSPYCGGCDPNGVRYYFDTLRRLAGGS